MKRGIAWIDFQADVADVVLAQNARRGLIPDTMTFETYFVLVRNLCYGRSGEVYTANAVEPSRCSGGRCCGGRGLVRVVTVLARDVSCHRVWIFAGLMRPIRRSNRVTTEFQELRIKILGRYCAAVAHEANRSLLRAAEQARGFRRGVRPMAVLTAVIRHVRVRRVRPRVCPRAVPGGQGGSVGGACPVSFLMTRRAESGSSVVHPEKFSIAVAVRFVA